MNVIYRGKTAKEFVSTSLLFDAIEDFNLRFIKQLLVEKGADPNLVLPRKGMAPIHIIIGNDNSEFALTVTSLMLQNGANPNVRSEENVTPVHIAACWGKFEILQLLLSCGGDPDVRDDNNKLPITYAEEEGFYDCVDLLKSFLPDIKCLLNREVEDSVNFNLTLDKIIVNNASTVDEYEIVNEYKDSNSIYHNDIEKLEQLPGTNSTEYILNWCNKYLKDSSNSSTTNTTDTSEISDNSLNESDCDDKVKVSLRKNTSPIKASRKIQNIPKIVINSSSNLATTWCEESSSNRFSDYFRISGVTNLSISTTDIDIINDNNILVNKNKSKLEQETSSDYVTCSSNYSTPPNILNQTIIEISDDNDTKSEGIGSNSNENSFESVSEIYKYVDQEEGIVLYERRFLKNSVSDGNKTIRSSILSSNQSLMTDYDADTLRKELEHRGYNPGPITVTTKRVYLKKLRQLRKQQPPLVLAEPVTKKVYSVELEKTLRNNDWYKNVTRYRSLEDVISKQFSNPDPSRKWREGVNKSSFTYLLLDPRKTNNLPCRADILTLSETWECFLSSIFYVGKGKRARPYSHLYDAVTLWHQGERNSSNRKLKRILNIWQNNNGVICLHVFQNVIPVEAYTREAAMISALKIENVCNIKSGDFYGIPATWPQREKRMLGVYLLYKAMMIFLNEGERQLCPSDIN